MQFARCLLQEPALLCPSSSDAQQHRIAMFCIAMYTPPEGLLGRLAILPGCLLGCSWLQFWVSNLAILTVLSQVGRPLRPLGSFQRWCWEPGLLGHPVQRPWKASLAAWTTRPGGAPGPSGVLKRAVFTMFLQAFLQFGAQFGSNAQRPALVIYVLYAPSGGLLLGASWQSSPGASWGAPGCHRE